MTKAAGQGEGTHDELVACVERGAELDLLGGAAADNQVLRTLRDSQAIDAAIIRDIIRGKRARNADPRGLRLRGARIHGCIDLENVNSAVGLALSHCYIPDGINVCDATLPALTLADCLLEAPTVGDRLNVLAIVSFVGSTISLSTSESAVRLVAARVGGSLSCTGARIYNTAGPALDLERIHIQQNVYLRGDFAASVSTEREAIRLLGARIEGQLDCTRSTIQNAAGPAMNADSMQVGQSAYFREEFRAEGGGQRPAMRLDRARIGGSLELSVAGIKNTDNADSQLSVDGLLYEGTPYGVSVESWLGLLGKAEYAAQPYQQLAAACEAAGHDKDKRKVLMAQRDHQIQSKSLTGGPTRAWARVTGWLLGYGYQSWRSLIWLAAVLLAAVSICLFWTEALVHSPSTSEPGSPCTVMERVGVGIDMGLPLVETGAKDTCIPSSRTAGTSLMGLGWTLQLLAWAFATLFVAGFTGAVRKL